MNAELIFYLITTVTFMVTTDSFPGDGWMRPMEKDINPNCWKCEPSPEELSECDESLLTHGRKCGILQSRFVERGNHCIVEIVNCYSKFSSAYQAEANFIVARGRLIDDLSSSNDTSLRYFPLSNPVEPKEVMITCTLNGIWETMLSIGNRVEVNEMQCITSSYQTMNHISPHITKIYRRR
uniref:NTR domain-containing protein n=1 Tax=Elaeophora elaphi TaxID=1147741 RepID=A0A0R3RWX8_9BILA